MQTNQTIQSLTYILGGAIMQMSHCIGNSWGGSLVTILGFFLFITGLRKLKAGLDDHGQKAAGVLVIAAMGLAIVTSFLVMIPFVGVYIASFFALASVGLIFLGWLKVQSGLLETVQA